MPNASVLAAAAGLPSSRRGFVLGLAALPAASNVAAADRPDPHVAYGEDAVFLWRQVQDLKWGWGFPDGTPECNAADNALGAFTQHCIHVVEALPPETLAGLRGLATTMMLAQECQYSNDLTPFDATMFMFLEQVAVMTGVVMPEGYSGLRYSWPKEINREAPDTQG